MSNSDHPHSPAVSGEETPITSSIEEKLHHFWERYRTVIVALCVVVVVVILGRGVTEYLAGQQMQAVQADYALADSPEKLKQFADDNEGHELAAVARVQVADAAYADGQGAAAIESYRKAVEALEDGPLADRAALGLAMSQIMAGKNTEGIASLEVLESSEDVASGVRVEAAYNLARLAHSDNDAATVKTHIYRIMLIDPASPWAQRVIALQIEEAPVMSATTSTDVLEAETADEAEPVIRLNLSGSE